MTIPSHAKNRLPRWRGFNLLEMFVWEPGREQIAAGDAADFRESDFLHIRDFGFDFVRIPMDYRFWTQRESATGAWTYHEPALRRIDRLVALGRQYGLHVSLNFHHAPGYCVNVPQSEWTLWTEPAAQGMFAAQWNMFAQRYREVPSELLSFDLLNEPPEVSALGGLTNGMTRANHERVIRAAVAAIRMADPQRRVMANGISYGNEPVEEIVDLAHLETGWVGQSCRAYLPFDVSHYQAPWVKYDFPLTARWPGAEHFGTMFDVAKLESHYGKWVALIERGVGVHCGEGGAYSRTPHDVALAWYGDVLKILRRHDIGSALWNFRGDFGILDSKRSDVAYEDFHGSKLDRQYLELLQAW